MADITSKEKELEQREEGEGKQIIKITDIKIGGDRLRKRVGDVSSLASSISNIGLLHPVAIDQNNNLIGGARRIEAFKQLGKDTIPSHRVNTVNPKQAEYDENVERSDFALEDIAEIYNRVRASRINHRPAAAEKEKEGGEGEEEKAGNSPTFPKGDSDFVTGRICGYGEQTINKIVKIIDVAKNNPQVQEIVDRIDSRGEPSINYAHKMVLRMEDRDRPKLAPPQGQYEILYVDPPWSYDLHDISGTPEEHYSTMTDEEIMQLVVPAGKEEEDNAVLFLWVPYPKNEVAFDVIASWGFQYKSKIVWYKKNKLGTGHYVRSKHEELFICIKGEGFGLPAEQDRFESVIETEYTGEHSKKPSIFYEIIEKMYPGRTRIELFARGKSREGWTSWGLEAEIPNALAIETGSEEEEEGENNKKEDPDLVRFRTFGRAEFQNSSPRLYNHMNFTKLDPRLGQGNYPGNIAGQIVQNVLYYWSKPNDLVVDPMAGGGTTIDACKVMGRRCLAYDIHSVRSDISQHDISQGFPEEAQSCNLVFLDPPYGNIMQKHYSKESISSASIEDFMSSWKT